MAATSRSRATPSLQAAKVVGKHARMLCVSHVWMRRHITPARSLGTFASHPPSIPPASPALELAIVNLAEAGDEFLVGRSPLLALELLPPALLTLGGVRVHNDVVVVDEVVIHVLRRQAGLHARPGVLGGTLRAAGGCEAGSSRAGEGAAGSPPHRAASLAPTLRWAGCATTRCVSLKLCARCRDLKFSIPSVRLPFAGGPPYVIAGL